MIRKNEEVLNAKKEEHVMDHEFDFEHQEQFNNAFAFDEGAEAHEYFDNLDEEEKQKELQERFSYLPVEKPKHMVKQEKALRKLIIEGQKRLFYYKKAAKGKNAKVKAQKNYHAIGSTELKKRAAEAAEKQTCYNAVLDGMYDRAKRREKESKENRPMDARSFHQRRSSFLNYTPEDLKISNDREFAENLSYNYAILDRVDIIKKQLEMSAREELELPMSEEEKEQLFAQIALFEQMRQWVDCKAALMSDPYYVLLRMSDVDSYQEIIKGMDQLETPTNKENKIAQDEFRAFLGKVEALENCEFSRMSDKKKEAAARKSFQKKTEGLAARLKKEYERAIILTEDLKKVESLKAASLRDKKEKTENRSITGSSSFTSREYEKKYEAFKDVKITDLKCGSYEEILENVSANAPLLEKAEEMHTLLAKALAAEDPILTNETILPLRAKLMVFQRVRYIQGELLKKVENADVLSLKQESLKEWEEAKGIAPIPNPEQFYNEQLEKLKAEQADAKQTAADIWKLINKGKELNAAGQDTKSREMQKNAVFWKEVQNARDVLLSEDARTESLLRTFSGEERAEYQKPAPAVLLYMRGKSAEEIRSIYRRSLGTTKEQYLLFKEIVDTTIKTLDMDGFAVHVQNPEDFLVNLKQKATLAELASYAADCMQECKHIAATDPDLELTEKEKLSSDWEKEAETLQKFSNDHLMTRIRGIMDLASRENEKALSVISLGEIVRLRQAKESISEYLNSAENQNVPGFAEVQRVVLGLDRILKTRYSESPEAEETEHRDFSFADDLGDVYYEYGKAYGVRNLAYLNQRDIIQLSRMQDNAVYATREELKNLREFCYRVLAQRYELPESEYYRLSAAELKRLTLESMKEELKEDAFKKRLLDFKGLQAENEEEEEEWSDAEIRIKDFLNDFILDPEIIETEKKNLSNDEKKALSRRRTDKMRRLLLNNAEVLALFLGRENTAKSQKKAANLTGDLLCDSMLSKMRGPEKVLLTSIRNNIKDCLDFIRDKLENQTGAADQKEKQKSKPATIANVKAILNSESGDLDALLAELDEKVDASIEKSYDRVQKQMNEAVNDLFEAPMESFGSLTEEFDAIVAKDDKVSDFQNQNIDNSIAIQDSIKEEKRLKTQIAEYEERLKLKNEELEKAKEAKDPEIVSKLESEKAEMDEVFDTLKKAEAHSGPEFVYLQGIKRLYDTGALVDKEKKKEEKQVEKDPSKVKIKDLLKTSMDKTKGQGKYIQTVVNNYFKYSIKKDKRQMMGAMIRELKPVHGRTHSKNGVFKTAASYLGGMLKGAGPLFQKLMQGVPEDCIMPELKSALSDVKSRLAPIPDDYVNQKLKEMAKSTNGRVTEIQRVRSLGAASVGQAFLCRIYGPDLPAAGKEVVVKLLRPDALERIEREKKILTLCARKTDDDKYDLDKALADPDAELSKKNHVKSGMEATLDGQIEKIMEELDLTIEANNAKQGYKTYNNQSADTEKEVTSVGVNEDIPVTKDSLVLEKAEGVAADRYLEEAKKLWKDIDALTPFKEINGHGEVRYKLSEEKMALYKEKREKLGKLMSDITKRQNHLAKLSNLWIRQAIYGNKFHHGDLHAGNIMISEDKVTVIDYGNATELTDEQRNHILAMTTTVVAGPKFAADFLWSFAQLLPKSAKEEKDGAIEKDLANVQKHPRFKGKGEKFLTEVKKIMKIKHPDNPEDVQAGEKIALILMKAQEMGLELPPSVQNFSQCELRLQNTITDYNLLIEQIRKEADFLDNMDYGSIKIADPVLMIYADAGTQFSRTGMVTNVGEALQNTLATLEGVDENIFLEDAKKDKADKGDFANFEAKYLNDIKGLVKSHEFAGDVVPPLNPSEFIEEWKELFEIWRKGLPSDPLSDVPKETEKVGKKLLQAFNSKTMFFGKGIEDVLAAFGGTQNILTLLIDGVNDRNPEAVRKVLDIFEFEVPLAIQVMTDYNALREAQQSFFVLPWTLSNLASTLYSSYKKFMEIKSNRADFIQTMLKNLNADRMPLMEKPERYYYSGAFGVEKDLDTKRADLAKSKLDEERDRLFAKYYPKEAKQQQEAKKIIAEYWRKEKTKENDDKSYQEYKKADELVTKLKNKYEKIGKDKKLTPEEKTRCQKAESQFITSVEAYYRAYNMKHWKQRMEKELAPWFEEKEGGKEFKTAYEAFRQVQEEEIKLKDEGKEVPLKLSDHRIKAEAEFLKWYKKLAIKRIKDHAEIFKHDKQKGAKLKDFMTVVGEVCTEKFNMLLSFKYLGKDLVERIQNS